MADQPIKVSSAHVVGCTSHSISTDGSTAMIVLDLPADGQFALTLPVDRLEWLRSILSSVIVDARKRGLETGKVKLLRFPHGYSVGSSNDEIDTPEGKRSLRGAVILTFDQDSPDEATFVFTNLDGMNLGDALHKDIKPRMTMEERREYQTRQNLSPKIIRPGH